jgi:hypothetical protein
VVKETSPFGPEEPLRFVRNFNDLFFGIGVALLGGGLVFFTYSVPLHSFLAAVLVWALAELLVARMRLVLSGILLVIVFTVFILLASPIDFFFARASQPFEFEALKIWFLSPRTTLPQPEPSIWPLMAVIGVATAAPLLFFARFRLPFALLMVAAGLICAVLTATLLNWPEMSRSHIALLLFGCGFTTFLAAMVFDASDRERQTRRADFAFWLHLLAAPLIVHSLIELVWPRPAIGRTAASLTSEVAIAVALIFAVLSVLAIIIDRRALLVSALTYFGIVIGYAISGTIGQQGTDQTVIFFATLLVLGAFVVTIGVGWQPLRRFFLRRLSPGFARLLPPPAQVRVPV